MDIARLILLCAFPGLSLWLPGLMTEAKPMFAGEFEQTR
jgi:hypothetical protein